MISIVIPSYNEGNVLLETIRRLIDNISNSSYKLEYEILVIDSSTDDKFKTMQLSKLRYKDRINVIRSKSRMFPGGARNLGVKNSKYDIIVFTDAGFTFEKDWFVRLTEPLLNDDSVDISWGVTRTSISNPKDRLFAYLIESKQKQRRIIPNVAMRKKVFTDGHWFKGDLRAVEDTRFIHEINGKYNEVFVKAINYYSGHPQSLADAFNKWSVYSYYSYNAGYRKKALLSILQMGSYAILIILLKNELSFLSIILFQFLRVIIKSNNKYKINALEFIYVLALSFCIDFGRLHGSLKAIFGGIYR